MGLRLEDLTRDGSDVDHAAGIAVMFFGGFLEEREEGEGGEVELGNVGLVGCCPIIEIGIVRLEEVLLQICTGLSFGLLTCSIDAGVVDKDAEA